MRGVSNPKAFACGLDGVRARGGGGKRGRRNEERGTRNEEGGRKEELPPGAFGRSLNDWREEGGVCVELPPAALCPCTELRPLPAAWMEFELELEGGERARKA